MSSSNVTFTINGMDYPMACAPGEEQKVEALGARIDEVARQVAAASGAIGESRLLVMAALILTDQMNDLEDQLKAKGEAAPATPPATPPVTSSVTSEAAVSGVDEDALADIIEGLTARLEKLASDAG
ncbi:MAG: cell division protein ZapA [Alphaproteobacteria bacterium]|nr:cell division protein ZapA [Alphaproteobacteria bacterium]